MKNLLRIFLSVLSPLLLLGLILGLVYSCGSGTPKDKERRILVIHSWDSSGEEGEYFQTKMKEEFKREGINAKVFHIYANLRHTTNETFTEYEWPSYLDSIRAWKPEIILLNDDPILRWVFKERPCDSLFFNTPVVFAGINGLQRDSVMKYPLMTGFGNNINLPRCIEMMYTITGKHLVFVELDNSDYDVALRKKFYGQISDTTRFINNDIAHLPNIDLDYINKTFSSKTVVDFVSFTNPRWVIDPEHFYDDTYIENRLHQVRENAAKAVHIQVKYDIYSNSLLDYAKVPQFTCIRAQFNNPKELRILGGFFTSTEVQIKDQVDYASRILKGTSPTSLNPTVHMSDFYMDYNAMKKYHPALKYESFSNKYHIINAPMALESPILYYLIIGVVAAVVFLIITLMAQLLYRWRQKGQRELLDDLLYEEKMHNLIFSNSDDTLWHIKGRSITFVKEFTAKHHMDNDSIMLREFQKMVHPDSMKSFDMLQDFRKQRGKKTLRFRLSFDNGKTWSWHEMTYTATEESATSGYLYGIMLNIDKKKEVEDTLSQAQMKASEVALKENFLANISHDLRTPLNAITGFSMLLTNKDMVFEEGEREEYGKIIHQNTDMILNMIDSVMQKAQLETGELELIMKPVNINDVVDKAYNTNKIIAPTHLQFILDSPHKDFMVNIDETRTMQVINNFLSNSFKFTTEGSITLGWKIIASENMAEVFVRDTGIGVDEEGQKHLFDRYYKQTENDKGTGLGLNISKTIIEKQGGKIGVESKLGKGSKFFFKLPRLIQNILIVLGFGISAGLFTSCNPQRKVAPQKNILVIHGYSQKHSNYLAFDECIQSTLRAQNINANLKNVYLSLENPANTGEKIIRSMIDSINSIGWKPNIILAEGDRVIYDISHTRNHELLAYIDSLPVVFGGLHHPNWNLLRGHKNIIVFYDPIDYPSNINLAVELSGKNSINIELDSLFQDSITQKELEQSIARPPFVNKINSCPRYTSEEEPAQHYRDSIIIYSCSAAGISIPHQSHEQGNNVNEEILMQAWMFPQLAVKMDMYSNFIIDKTNRPQFSAVKAGFGDESGRFLAGYFAGYETVATDMAMTAAKILHGNRTNDMSGKQHEKHYYMDYRAMQKLGLNYFDYSDRFVIVNAPIKYKYPILFYAEYVALFFFALIIIVIWLGLINYWRERSDQMLISSIKQKANLRILSLNGADSRPLRNEEGVKEVLELIHPDHKENIQFIKQSLQIEGAHQYDIYADIDQDKQYEWWQLRFVVFNTKGGRQRIDGLVININESKKYEEEMRVAIQLAEEAKQKEDFLMTISHEIRTPLNAVVGFSDVIISLPPDALSQEELDEISFNINENNAKLAAMIEDILMFSRIESGRLRYVNSEFNASEILEELYTEWLSKIPHTVHFTNSQSHNDIYINSDRVRVKYILNQLISNAVKFTESGDIIMTTFYHFKDQKVEFRIEDSGCGISQEKQTAVFNLFWKDNEFVPGLGLGLNIAHKLAEGMNAKLEVDSREGYGSVFSLLMDASIKKDNKTDTEKSTEKA